MSQARRSEGPRAPLFFPAAALLLVSAKITTAQTVDLSSLELCAGLETQDLRLACFEAIIAADMTPQIPEAGAVETPVADLPAAKADAVPEMAPAIAATPAVATAVAATPESPPAIEAVPTNTAAVATDTEFGHEYLDPPGQKENEILRARVTNVTKDHYKVLYFHLDNGHVWRQMEARHFEYPKNGEFDINITRGMMGEYRLRIGDDGRLVRIRRVK